MTERSGGFRGQDRSAYYKRAEGRRAFEYTFREHNVRNNRSDGTYGVQARTSPDLGGSTLNIMNPHTARQWSAEHLYSDAGGVDSDAEAPNIRFNQRPGAHRQRVASDNGSTSGNIYPRPEVGRYLYSTRLSEYDEDGRVSSRRRSDHVRSAWRGGVSASDDPQDSDWEDGLQGGSGGSPGMFDSDRERWLGSEYDDHQECDCDSEDEYYYESGSEVFGNESHYGSEYFIDSSGGEENYWSETDVGSDWSDEVYYYDSD